MLSLTNESRILIDPDPSTDFPCPWCHGPTAESDRSCPTCNRVFGRISFIATKWDNHA